MRENRENRERPHWEGKHYSFFRNTECEYFPCHRIADPARFSCLFCYCPLYMLGPHCGGNFRYTEKGIKDCTDCLIPHLPENYGRITGKFKEIAAAMRKPEQGASEESRPEEEQALETPGRGPTGRIVLLACTERGFETMRRAASALEEQLPDAQILQTGRCACVAGFEDGPRLSVAAARWFPEADALIFIAAAGIAVRCIAPFVRDKFRDPAVLAVDENGRFVISLLSGHAGGANRLCGLLAEALGAQPVITTATDGRGLFAVDVFAAENGLQISDRTTAKQISARILAGEILKIYFEEGLQPPAGSGNRFENDRKGVCRMGVCRTPDRADADIIVSFRYIEGDRKEALYLIPRAVVLGIGCRRGTTVEAVRKAALQILRTSGVFRRAVAGIASIDLKKEEAGLLAFAEEWDLPLTFYAAEELARVPGTFSSSEFVRTITGVDCVCERSALLLAMDDAGGQEGSRPAKQTAAGAQSCAGRKDSDGWKETSGRKERTGKQAGRQSYLLQKKQSLDGVTAALAVRTMKEGPEE